ncbi:MAG: response regulator [Desulfobacteraceae bacterium]|jgi:signal transduction histidine kinase/ActR/RegA family two-component response regulator
MFNTINRKFYAIAGMMAALFAVVYGGLAYYLGQQSRLADRARAEAAVEREIRDLKDLFFEIRFWDRAVIFSDRLQAEGRSGVLTQEIRQRIAALSRSALDEPLKTSLNRILPTIEDYEETFGRMAQQITEQRLNTARMSADYQSLTAAGLRSRKTSLYPPLFNLAHFHTTYLEQRGQPEYHALKIVIASLQNRFQAAGALNDRLQGYLADYMALLERDNQLETELARASEEFDIASNRLTSLFTTLAAHAEQRLQAEFLEAAKLRSRIQRSFLFFAILGIAGLLFTLALMARKIVHPVQGLAAVMRRVKDGEIGTRFNGGADPGEEITRLGEAFNTMLDTLEANNRQLLAYQQELETKVRELAAGEASQRRLEAQLQRAEKMEAIGMLAGGVAHDLNNILSGVVSYPELLLMEMAPENPMRQPIETIKRSGEKAAAIVQDLLTLARRGVAITEKIDLNVLIRRYLGSPEYQVLMNRHPQVAVETRLAADLMPIDGSPVHLSKTIMNLVANAAEAMPGGGRIDIETANRHIDQPVSGYDDVRQGAYVTFRIADGGVGIAPADLRRIFEPFYTKKVMGKSGSGLGMAVVWGTVKDHNGYIDVQSTEGRGTVFTLYLPVAQQRPAAPEPQPAAEELLGRGEQVLVVDDMPEQRQIAAAMLEKLGYAVHTVASGEEAVSHMTRNRADLLVLDMIMDPGIDGLETYRQILELHPGQKAIIVSGFSENERVRAAQALGAGAYLRKPYTYDKIGLAVRTELDRPAAAVEPNAEGDRAT